MDAAVRAGLAALGGPRGGVAVVALGGYARRELCPASDVDLLLVHDGWHHGDLSALVEALCYPLWDAGLSVGHAVRTPREAVRAAASDLETATALSDRRLVAGDGGLADDLTARSRRWLRRRAAPLLADLAAADAARHARAGAHPGFLEPDLKAGAGGLRDLHSLRWAAACLLGEPTLDALVGARYLGAAERADLAEAGDALLAARCALHLVTHPRPGAAADRLRLDLQDEVASRLGLSGGDELLRRVGLACRYVAHVAGRTWPLLRADAARGRSRRRAAPEPLGGGAVLRRGVVELTPDVPAADPAMAWRAVAAAAARGSSVGRETSRRLRGVWGADGMALRWDAATRAHLLDVLTRGPAAVAALADADHAGLLAAGLPGWERVRGRPQRNPLHRFDLDTHGVEAVAWLADIARGRLDEAHRRLWEGLPCREALVLGTWLHDVGKAWPGDHSEVGAPVAASWVAHMGFGEAVAGTVARLVRHHLLLPASAAARDLDDEAEVAEVARTAGDVATLDALYLLSLADARATGPAAWSAWSDSLLARLHARARRLLGAPGAAAAGGALRDSDDVGSGERPGVRLSGGPVAGTRTVTVVAPDRHGLFADVAGVLAGRGLGVLEARLRTAGGLAVEAFVVASAGDADGADDALEAELRAAAAGQLDVEGLVARRERRRDERRPPLARPVPVEVGVARVGRLHRVSVRAADTPGLLHRLARTLADEGLDVVAARVTTLGPEARDAFDVRGWPDGHAADPLRRRLADAAR